MAMTTKRKAACRRADCRGQRELAQRRLEIMGNMAKDALARHEDLNRAYHAALQLIAETKAKKKPLWLRWFKR